MINIIFIAPPSAGKGTQSELLKEKYGYTHISTGDLLRNVVKEGTELGKEIAAIQEAGELVSDEIVNKLLIDALKSSDKFILDGYPRNIDQAENLTNIFNELNITDYVTMYLDIDGDTAMKRVLGRITCSGCSAIYNRYTENLKPTVDGICDKCSKEIIQRSDDNEESFKKRFDTYISNLEPVMNYYKDLGVLRYVKVEDDKMDTCKNIEDVLNDYCKK